MKTARIINGLFFSLLTMGLTALVCYEWKRMGCEWNSLALAIGFYGSCLCGVWYVIDKTIIESHE